MRILVVSSEVVPFAKTGGLADVAGALPIELARLGHDVRVAMPKYAAVDDGKFHLLPILDEIIVRFGQQSHATQIKRTVFPGTDVPVYFVQNTQFFGRQGLYQQNGVDYPDNAIRFAVFCKAVIWLLKGLDWIPDVIHCNDWQTALVPVYLRTEGDMLGDEALANVKLLYTIHNLAYQGLFDPSQAPAVGVSEELFHPAGLEFYGKLNLMKGGIIFSDEVSTVSRRYAGEIQTPEYGCGLEGVLTARRAHLHGIINGIDYSVWNPETDKLIPHRYSQRSLAGKAKCKAALQEETGLDRDPDAPLIGIISRLDQQKGFDLITEALDDIIAAGAQIVLLGTGAPEFHEQFEAAALRHSGKLSANLRFDNTLAHRIEAGSDMFLMPSRFEPCGLNQLYSLKYGTLPVVRRTGGLEDSIVDATPDAVKAGTATGFVFDGYTADEMLAAIRRALDLFAKKTTWKKIQKTAMAQDFSWTASAKIYEALFRKMTKAN